jgi:hypothetical protein
MKNPDRLLILVLLSTALLGAVAFFSSGCTSTGPLAQPSAAFTQASRSFHTVIGLRFKMYVTADASLDPATRDVLLHTVDDWDFMIRAAEQVVAPAAGTPASVGERQ